MGQASHKKAICSDEFACVFGPRAPDCHRGRATDDEHEATDVAVCPIRTRGVDDATGQFIELDVASLVLQGEDGFIPSDEFRRRHMGRGGMAEFILKAAAHGQTNYEDLLNAASARIQIVLSQLV